MSQGAHAHHNALRPAALRYPVLIFLSAVLFVAAAVFASSALHTPQYTAEARLMVGRVNVAPQAVPAVVEASRQLASSYARVAHTPVVKALLAEQQQQQGDGKRPLGSFAASPIPNSPVIRIQATSPSEADAVLLANQAARALQKYVTQINDPTADLDQMLAQYTAAATQNADAARHVDELRARKASSADIDAAEATLAAARLRVESLASQYTARQSQAQGTGNVELIAPASSLGDDTRQTLQLWSACALLAGTALGMAASSAITRRKSRPVTTNSRLHEIDLDPMGATETETETEKEVVSLTTGS